MHFFTVLFQINLCVLSVNVTIIHQTSICYIRNKSKQIKDVMTNEKQEPQFPFNTEM